jgi:PDZ domain-containing secreted protein
MEDNGASVISITKASSRDKLGVYFAYSKGDGITVSKLRENVSRYLVGKFHVGQQIVSVDGTCYANPAELVKYVNSCPAGVAINFCVKPLQGNA